MNERKALNTTTGLSRLIKVFKIREQSGLCPECGEVLINNGAVDLVPKQDATELIMENVEVIHHRCLYRAMKRVKLEPVQLAQASHSEAKQGEDKQEVVKPKRLTLVCTLHAERKSEVWLARTCKHYLCAECELKRQTTGECPACLATHTDQQASQTGSLAV